MKRRLLIALPLSLCLLFTACGGKPEVKEEENKADNPLEALENLAEETQQGQDAATKKLAERRAKGDTLAMPYEELMKFLPESIDGYTRGEPDGETVNMPPTSFTSVNVNFTNDKGDDIKVTIVDYNQAYSMYSGLTMMWAMGMSVDSPEKKAQGVKFEGDIAGWEEFNKKTGRTELTLGVGYRFWVQVQADNQTDTENVKAIAKKIDLKKLAEM